MSCGSLLIGDLGGTHARFALATHGDASNRTPTYEAEQILDCTRHDSAESAIEAYLEMTQAPRPSAICLAVAGPIVGNVVRFLNNPWSVDAGKLAEHFPGAKIRLVHDFHAIAHAVPLLGPEHVEPVGFSGGLGLPQKGDFTIGIIGPGTGLGVGALIRSGGKLHALSSEGGHLGFAPETQVQLDVLEKLRERFDRVSDERLLSGPGIENIYWALQNIHGQASVRREAAEIFQRAREDSDQAASDAEQLFFEVLGQVAGNLALTLGAREGIYIAGGVVRRYPDRLKAGPFRAGFENKGRHRSLMETIPTFLITHPHPGLLGAGHLVQASDKPV